MAIENPQYKVLVHEDSYELREYDRMIRATVRVQSDNFMNAMSQGFGPLADYIFGNNSVTSENLSDRKTQSDDKAASQKIAMTAPVTASLNSDGSYKVAFTMPRSYTMTDLPHPNNDSVKHEKISSQKMCVIRFSGRAPERKVQEKISELKQWARQKGYTLQGKPVLSIYNPPWKPGFLRRNEVSFTVSS